MNLTPPPTIDFGNLKRGMFIHDNQEPISAIVAAIPDHSGLVTLALHQLNNALSLFMEPQHIVILLRDQIQLNTGQILTLGPHSIFFSLSYPTAQGRIFEMELAAPEGATIH